jgi:hypothetical protein
LSTGLIREPGDDVGVINECHTVTNTTQPSRQEGGKTPPPVLLNSRRDLEGHAMRRVPHSTLAVTR